MALSRVLLGLLAVLMWAVAAEAGVKPDEVLDDPVLEARARALGQQLRCLVCQNQSIDDSDAPLAADIRRLVREQLLAGKSDQEIKDYLVARFGEFILLKPPFTPRTWILWFGPFVVFALGGLLVYVYLRRSRERDLDAADGESLSPEELEKLARLLGEEGAARGQPQAGSS